MSAAKPLEVAIWGCGAVAGGGALPDCFTHAGAYAAAGGFRIVAAIDPDPARRAAFASRWQVPATFADLPDDLAVDVVSLCTPTACHAGHLARLRGHPCRAVFAEKPLMADARGFPKPLLVNHLRRFDPAMRALREEIAAGQWGALKAATALYTKGILNNGSHMIDLAQYLLGPARLLHAGPARADHDAADPTADAVLEIAGAPFHLAGGDARDFSVFELTLVFAGGMVTVEDGGFAVRRRRAVASPRFAGYRTLESGSMEKTALDQAMTLAARDLKRCLAEGGPLASDAASAHAAEALCRAILAAAR
ncbi:MAG: hypothetical protein OHK0024_32840 [Thalassobaculales bacterium]